MMTLEESIKHCKDVALSCTNKECALEHFQLLKWLQEYSNILKKQDKAFDKIAERARTEKQRILVTESDGVANIDWDTRSLEDAKMMLEYGLDYIKKLEKQGEQKSTDKVKPKFKVGDWICNDMCDVHIASIENGMYYFDEGDGLSIVFVDEHYHLWTIEEARDGDVLIGNKGDVILIFRGIGNEEWNDVIDYYCRYDCNREEFIVQGDLEFWGYVKDNELKPATKEQRDLLFAKIKESGYEWDAEKKKLLC